MLLREPDLATGGVNDGEGLEGMGGSNEGGDKRSSKLRRRKMAAIFVNSISLSGDAMPRRFGGELKSGTEKRLADTSQGLTQHLTRSTFTADIKKKRCR